MEAWASCWAFEYGLRQVGVAGLEVFALAQPVVDGSRDVAALGEAGRDLDIEGARLVAAGEAAAVDPDEGRAQRFGIAVRLVEVEVERLRLAVLVDCLTVGDVVRDRDGGEDLVAVADAVGSGRLPRQRDRDSQDEGTGCRASRTMPRHIS